MTLINDIINRRKKGAAGSERREFTVDRTRAIEKMRRFALEDPRYYLLELIQAAIANSARFISIDLFRLRTERDDLKMRWYGRGFSGLELSRLFDFLFMSDDDPGCDDTILLARGVNAMLHFRPESITISCGDGTIDGSRRFAIYPDESEPVELPLNETIDGVRIHANALRSSLLPPGPSQGLGAREVLLLEEKCIAPKVRVMLNGRWVSDWNAAYTDQMKTGSDYVQIDEPDLYGRLWKTMGSQPSRFDLMTWGVKIESVERTEPPFGGLSGAINYDRLNKTADHAHIVRDEVLDELWARLEPYASKLQRGGRGQATYDIRNLQMERYEPKELLEVVRRAERVIAVPDDVLGNATAYRAAEQIRDAFGAPVLAVDKFAWQTLRMLVGSDCEIVVPSLLEQLDVDVFTRGPASPPPRPWLTEPLTVEPIPVGEFVRYLCEAHRVEHGARERVKDIFGSDGEVDLRVYTPEDDGDTGSGLGNCWVRVLVCERTVWEGEVDTVYPGHRLYVELPALSPSALAQDVRIEAGPDGRREIGLVQLIAKMAVSLARDELRRAGERALRALSRVEVEPGSLAARIALNSLSRGGLLRVRRGGESAGSKVVLSIVDEESAGLLDVAICRTMDGQSVSARVLGEMLHDQGGLIYGARSGSELDLSGMTAAPVLALDAEQERLIVALVGADAYVRADERQDQGALLADREDVAQLVDRLRRDGDEWHDQEARRQARRHLLRYLVRSELARREAGSDARRAPGEMAGVDEFGLIETADGERCSFRDVIRAMESGEGVSMADGRAVDVVEPSVAEKVERAAGGSRLELRCNPYLLYLLQELGPVGGAFDFDLSVAEAQLNDETPDAAFIAEERLDERGVSGVIGLSVEPVSEPAIALIERDSRRVRLLREPARRLGLVGRVIVDDGMAEQSEQVYELVIACGERVLERLVEVAPRVEVADERHRVVETLLAFAAAHLKMTANGDDVTVHSVDHPLAERILEMPLFPTDSGTPVTGRTLVSQFCRANNAGEAFSSPLSEHASPSLHRWVEENLDPAKIYRSAPARKAREVGPRERQERDGADGDLLDILANRLDELWPDGAMEEFGGWLELDWQESEAASDEARIAVCEQRPAGEVKLYLARTHPLVKKAQQSEAPDSESFAWLLLAVFAELNARLESVTNDHELAFQRRVADVLEGPS